MPRICDSNKAAAEQDDTRGTKCCKYEKFIMHVLCAVFNSSGEAPEMAMLAGRLDLLNISAI